MKEFKGTKLDVQFGESITADFEENTWTFEMKEGFEVTAGEFAILPKSKYEELITKALGE